MNFVVVIREYSRLPELGELTLRRRKAMITNAEGNNEQEASAHPDGILRLVKKYPREAPSIRYVLTFLLSTCPYCTTHCNNLALSARCIELYRVS